MRLLSVIVALLALPMILWAALPALEPGAYYAPGKFIVNLHAGLAPLQVRLENGIAKTGIPSLDALNREYSVMVVEKLFPGSSPGSDAVELSGYYVFRFAGQDQARLEAVLNRYAAVSVVEHVEPVGIHPVFFTPNDPSYPNQWHLNQSNDHDIDAPEAWNTQMGNSGAILGIADTGVLWTHPDLSANIWTNATELNGVAGVDDDGNGYVDDIRGWDWVDVGSGWSGEDLTTPDNDPKDFNGHGTHVAGIAAAVTNNGVGVSGIAGGNYPAQGARIMALRIGWSGNYLGQEVGYIDMSYAASAFYYATQKGACAINCSWGSSNSGGLGAAVDNAVANGMVVCSAAGNSNNQTASYLCSRTDVVSVAATDQNDVKASFSSYGTWVDISAPGVSIYSTYSNHYTATYASLSGTSMATPCVVGLSGLLKSQNPTWTRTQIIPQILNTADNIDALNPSYVGKLGTGRINAAQALGGSGPVATITVTYPNGGETWTVGQSYTITWTSQNLTGNVNVKLNRAYPNGTWETLYSNIANTGSQAWTVSGSTGSACRIRVESAGDPTVYDESNANFTISSGTGAPVVLFTDTFDGNFSTGRYSRGDANGSNGKDYWDNETLKPHAGTRSCYCAGVGSPTHPPYDSYMNAYFYTKSGQGVNLTGYTNVTFSFWVWYETEAGYDFLNVQYYNGSSWVDFPNTGWSGSSSGWVQKTYTISGLTNLRYRFNFTSDGSITAEGAYVDDIQVTGVPLASNSLPGGEIIVTDLTPQALPLLAQSSPKAEISLEPVNSLPSEFRLYQNSPNPFNPVTTLTYSLPEAAVVNLTVYDAQGRQVAILAQGPQNPGLHSATFDGAGLAGGIYFAALQAGEFQAVRKMVLLK